MSFKDMVAADLHGVFLNVCEFAERRTVIYNGQTFDGADHGGIPVLLIQVKETEKPVRNTQGFFGVQAKLYAALSAWAEEEFRSVNGQIEYLLTQCVRKREKGKDVDEEEEM